VCGARSVARGRHLLLSMVVCVESGCRHEHGHEHEQHSCVSMSPVADSSWARWLVIRTSGWRAAPVQRVMTWISLLGLARPKRRGVSACINSIAPRGVVFRHRDLHDNHTHPRRPPCTRATRGTMPSCRALQRRQKPAASTGAESRCSSNPT
jgi:hypothetical protein